MNIQTARPAVDLPPIKSRQQAALDSERGSSDTDNTIPIEAWNTVLFEKFCRFRHLLSHGLSGHSDELFRRRSYARGARVLDVGCGFGDTTRRIAAQVSPGGETIGVDCAQNFIDLATREAAKASIKNVSFFVADAQCDDLGGPYDHAFSRFGTMFFNLPGLALRNIRRALAPGGELSMIVWRRREDNPWLHEAELRVRQIVPVIAHEDTDQVHCGPGPFSMSGPDMVSDMLRAAGYEHIAFARYDTDICIGRTLDEVVEFALALGPTGEIIRLAGKAGELRRGRLSPRCARPFLPISEPTAFGPARVPGSSRPGILRADIRGPQTIRPRGPGAGLPHETIAVHQLENVT